MTPTPRRPIFAQPAWLRIPALCLLVPPVAACVAMAVLVFVAAIPLLCAVVVIEMYKPTLPLAAAGDAQAGRCA